MADLITLAQLKTYLALTQSWVKSTTYTAGDRIRANGNLYECITTGTSSGSGTGPSGTTADITDGSAHWKYIQAQQATDDSTLSALISAVSSFFEHYCDRTFSSASYTYVTNGHGNHAIMLPESPVTAVLSVTVDGVVIAARPAVGSAGWVLTDNMVQLDGGSSYNTSSNAVIYRFNKGIANVSIAYTAGYSTLPNDLTQACIETCASWYKRRSRVDEESKSIQGEVITFSTAELPKAAKAILDIYKRAWPSY